MTLVTKWIEWSRAFWGFLYIPLSVERPVYLYVNQLAFGIILILSDLRPSIRASAVDMMEDDKLLSSHLEKQYIISPVSIEELASDQEKDQLRKNIITRTTLVAFLVLLTYIASKNQSISVIFWFPLLVLVSFWGLRKSVVLLGERFIPEEVKAYFKANNKWNKFVDLFRTAFPLRVEQAYCLRAIAVVTVLLTLLLLNQIFLSFGL